MRSYAGNVATFALRETSVEEIQRKPLQEVVSMVREAMVARAYDDHFQELAEWVEANKTAAAYHRRAWQPELLLMDQLRRF